MPAPEPPRPARLAGVLAFIRSGTAGGTALILAAVVAMAWANSPWAPAYAALLRLPVGLSLGTDRIGADPQWIINDGLMALFFLQVGLEIRGEITEGQLASLPRASAPVVAALGGMVVPAAIFVAVAHGDPSALRGWAVPVATDIAFSLAVLRLLGGHVPMGLKVFLTALAICDDLGAIVVIALFYSAGLDVVALGAAAALWLAMLGLNRAGVRSPAPYLAGFALLWACLARSGVHPTLSGVALAFVVPMAGPRSAGRRLGRGLDRLVALLILPLFGLANAGLPLAALSWAMLRDPLVPGIVLGLFVGKQVGVFASTWLACRLRLVALPEGLSFRLLHGAAVLCGIGFTVSLFIGGIAFPDGPRATAMKASVFAASLLSAGVGAAMLRLATRRGGEP